MAGKKSVPNRNRRRARGKRSKAQRLRQAKRKAQEQVDHCDDVDLQNLTDPCEQADNSCQELILDDQPEQESELWTSNCNIVGLKPSDQSMTCARNEINIPEVDENIEESEHGKLAWAQADDSIQKLSFDDQSEQESQICTKKHDIVGLKYSADSDSNAREGINSPIKDVDLFELDSNQEQTFDCHNEPKSEMCATLLQNIEQQYGQKCQSNTYTMIRTSVLCNLYDDLKNLREENKKLNELQEVCDEINKTAKENNRCANLSTHTDVSSALEETVCEDVQDMDQSLHIEFYESISPSPFPVGRIICDVQHVIDQARKLEKHSCDCLHAGSPIFKKTTRKGLIYSFLFICNKKMCNFSLIIKSDREKAALNNLSVLGALSTGSGYSQEEQKFSIMNMEFMNKTTFTRCEKIAGDVMKSFAKDTMEMAIEEEKSIATSKNDVNNDGSVNICAIVDGGWCKRSYGHGYNSSSGVAVIIGAATQKILYINVRNKVCLICSAIEEGRTNSKEHLCSKNWTGPSTAMESDIIVEGLKYLEEMYHIKCTKLIGDGDTNLMKKVKEHVSYGNEVRKIECANHAVRRYFRALEKLQKNAAKFPGVKGREARKILSQRISRLTVGAREAIKRHATKNLADVDSSKIEDLALELRNGPDHVFGSHGNCGQFCRRKNEQDLTSYNIMIESGLLSAIKQELKRVLISHVDSLIYNVTNNQAELFMSQLCKTVGGKRIDFSKSNSIKRRASIASLAYQLPGQKWQHEAHKKITGRSPRTPQRNFIAKRYNKYFKNLKRRKLFKQKRFFKKTEHVPRGGDEHYGDQASDPDLDVESFDLKAKMLIESLQVNSRDALEVLTRGQACNERWREERRNRLSSTYFKDVADRRPTTLSSNLVKRIIYPSKLTLPAIIYGQKHEDAAVAEYEANTNQKVVRCGLFIDPENPMLCTSPDGLIGNDGLLEVKCPYAARNVEGDLGEVCGKSNIGIRKGCNGEYYLPKRHKYFYQIQGQLNITNRDWCDLFVWSPKHSITLRIQKDTNFWKSICPKLVLFYSECCVPEIVDPRATRKLPLREPKHIIQAIEEKKKIDQKENKIKSKKQNKKRAAEIIIFQSDLPQSTPICRSTEVEQTSTETMSTPVFNNTIQDNTTPRPKRIRKTREILDL